MLDAKRPQLSFVPCIDKQATAQLEELRAQSAAALGKVAHSGRFVWFRMRWLLFGVDAAADRMQLDTGSAPSGY